MPIGQFSAGYMAGSKAKNKNKKAVREIPEHTLTSPSNIASESKFLPFKRNV